MYCTDGIDTRNTYNILTLTALPNTAPLQAPGASFTLTGSFIVGRPFTSTILKSNFYDFEGDSFSMTCSDNLPWTTLTPQNDDYLLTGTSPLSNTLVGSYDISCILTDIYSNSNPFTFHFILTENAAPTILSTPSTARVTIGT